MQKPLIAIVGRPNAGKSTLFNRIMGKTMAIVENMPGVTRDRLIGTAQYGNIVFDLMDTGGLDPQGQEAYLPLLKEQTQLGIEEADLLIFLTDVKEGLTHLDHSIAELLRRSGKDIVLAVNKVDSFKREENIFEFHQLGFEDIVPISSAHGRGIAELLDYAMAKLELDPDEPSLLDDVYNMNHDDSVHQDQTSDTAYVRADECKDKPPLHIAVVGRPNVGKSSIINALLGSNRLVTADMPGSTRDAVDTQVVFNGEEYIFIDTAGIRRKSSITMKVEKYSVVAAMRAMDRADVAIIVLDANQTFADQDARIISLAEEKGCGYVLVLNKWDLVPADKKDTKAAEAYVKEHFPNAAHAPLLTTSARTGQRVQKLFDYIEQVADNRSQRIPTSILNNFLQDLVTHHTPRALKGGSPAKLYFMTQARSSPPKFMISTNKPDGIEGSYKRYIVNSLRGAFDFSGVPIRLYFRHHDKKRRK